MRSFRILFFFLSFFFYKRLRRGFDVPLGKSRGINGRNSDCTSLSVSRSARPPHHGSTARSHESEFIAER